MRLDKFLSNMGIVSRKELKNHIRWGEVIVDGLPAKSSDVQIDENKSKVLFRGEEILYSEFVYIMLNKPSGYLSATEDKRDKTVVELLSERHRKMDLFPIGRLDKDTEGLLLMTNDGDTCHKLLSPKYHVNKKYRLESDKPLSENDIVAFSKGVYIEGGYKTLPALLEITDNPQKAYITITEGKFHQIKQMLGAVGKTVTYLERVEFALIPLDTTLRRGMWRLLSKDEIETLKKCCDKTRL